MAQITTIAHCKWLVNSQPLLPNPEKTNKKVNKAKNNEDERKPHHPKILQTVQSPLLPRHTLLWGSLNIWSCIGEQTEPSVLNLNLVAELVHHSVKQDFGQGDQEAEYEPDVNHLDIGSSRHRVKHTDEKC